jgi:hypothetical protein
VSDTRLAPPEERLEIDADEAWVSIHETADLMPVEGLEPRQHLVRLKMNGFALVNAHSVEFVHHGETFMPRFVLFRRGDDVRSGPVSVNAKVRKGDHLLMVPGNIRLSMNQ